MFVAARSTVTPPLRYVLPALACAALSCSVSPRPHPASAPRVVYLASDLERRAHDDWHYAPAIRAGDLLVLSGIPAARGGTPEEKIRNMFERVGASLAAAGASFDDVVELTTFHAASSREELLAAFDVFSKVHATVFRAPYPAWTAIGNALLLNKDAVVEMRVVAVVGSGRGARVERAGSTP